MVNADQFQRLPALKQPAIVVFGFRHVRIEEEADLNSQNTGDLRQSGGADPMLPPLVFLYLLIA